ncbi:MAG: GUN4 domain-containing protein [Cyanobacteria bacterium P01_D01_bin.50]
MSNKLVKRRLDEFQKRCGEEALHLASHAALPVALNPELLHFLRINFFSDSEKQLPYTVEIEFFTSGLCREIDDELYEIEPDIRNPLLEKLNSEYGLERIREIASLLWLYVKDYSPWEDRVELERAQQLTALHFLDREKAQQWLEQAQLNQNEGRAEREWFVAMRQEIEQLPEFTNDSPNQLKKDDLSSEKGVDYTRLRDLLKAGNWKEADEETLTVMLKAAGREKQDYLNSDDLENFPCTDLRTIDQLWVRYSNGRFGFSVQKRIWESVGQDIYKFGDRVGWRKGIFRTFFNNRKEWLYKKDLTFSMSDPEGHLPTCGLGVLADPLGTPLRGLTRGELRLRELMELYSLLSRP